MARIESVQPAASVKHKIASDLRFYREKRGLSLSQMGAIMGCSRHTVSNIEHARDGWNMNDHQTARLDAHLELNDHFAWLVMYARAAHDPDWFAEYAKYEIKASVIRFYRLSLIPGLFQTPEYARAVITAARIVEDVERAVQNRMKRQEVLTRRPAPEVWVLLDESVLHRPVGGPEVMYGQLERLREATETRNITLRVVPQAAGFYLGLDGSFNSLTLPAGDVMFVEAPGGGRLIQGGAELREFGVRWDRIGASALPWDASRDLIIEAMERLS
jgi:transcriptional regulator with XRE-family HTH domain